MLAYVLALASVLLRLYAAFRAVWLIRVTGTRRAWILIAAAVLLMALWHFLEVYQGFSAEQPKEPDLGTELIGFIISVFMVAGLWMIEPIFRRIEESARLLRESEARFRRLMEQASDGIFVSDPKGHFVDVNSKGCAMLGMTRDEILSHNIRDIVNERDIADVPMSRDDLYAGRPVIAERRMRRSDGTEFPAEVSARLHEDGLLQAIVRDITVRRENEAVLKSHSRQQDAVAQMGQRALRPNNLQELFELAVELIANVLDVEFTQVLELQPSKESFLLRAGTGWEAGMIGKVMVENNVHSQAGYTLKEDEPVIVKNMRFETRFSLPQGLTDNDVLSGISVVISAPTGAFGVLGAHSKKVMEFSTDVANFMHSVSNVLGAAIERSLAEKALVERDEQLRHSQKLEALGRLAGGVAHDFNNLLTAILGYVELMLSNTPKEDPRHLWGVEVQRAADRAADLTRQLLAFGRKQVLQPKAVSLNATIVEMESMLRRVIGEDVELVTDLDSSLDRVEADPGQLEQVIMNLVINARDALGAAGKIIIQSRAAQLSDSDKIWAEHPRPGRYATVAVIDNGVGMDEQTQARVFEPFFTTKGEQGSGLGLPTAYGIVKQSGGEIRVESRMGAGTTFRVYLPATSREVSDPIEATNASIDFAGSETILFAEDDHAVRELGESILRMNGYDVVASQSGNEALRIWEESGRRFQLLVTDVVMPGLSGIDLARELTKRQPDLQVLYISGYADNEVLHSALAHMNADFLQKPFRADDLLTKVRTAISASSRSF